MHCCQWLASIQGQGSRQWLDILDCLEVGRRRIMLDALLEFCQRVKYPGCRHYRGRYLIMTGCWTCLFWCSSLNSLKLSNMRVRRFYGAQSLFFWHSWLVNLLKDSDIGSEPLGRGAVPLAWLLGLNSRSAMSIGPPRPVRSL